jgi:tetratricopeptide (TPR) repeat protein
MKTRFFIYSILVAGQVAAQTPEPFSPFDARHWGVVLEHPAMKDVIVKPDVTYLQDEKGSLSIDIYLPPGLKSSEKRPAVVFLNGIGENPGQPKVKSWGIYKSWPRLMAANGFVGIAMETDGARTQESMQGLFRFLKEKGSTLQIDADRLGVYAASANVSQSAIYLMASDAYKGIKAAVLYYGGAPQAPFRKDLPVLFIISEGDVGRNGYSTLWGEVLRNNAPWTIKMATGLPHAFDAFEDTDEARKVVKETISFWKNHLEPVEQPSWKHAIPREILSAQYMQNHNRAADLTKQWLESHPEDADGLRAYSYSLKMAGRYAEAEAVFRKLLAAEQNDAGLLADMALVMYGLNRSEEAEKFMAQAMQKGSLNWYQYIGLARLLYNFKNYSASAKYYELAVALEPNAVDIYNMACSYALANEKEKAFESLFKSLEKGFTSKQQIENDTDLESLRTDTRFKLLLDKLTPAAGSQPVDQAKGPAKRAHHAMVYDEGSKSVVVISGSTPLEGGQRFQFFNDVWRYQQSRWVLAGLAGDERSGIALAYLTNGKSCGELRVLEGNEWKVLTDLPEMKATEPGLVYDEDRNRLVAFGGSSGRGQINGTTWEWDGSSWKKFEGQGPKARSSFAMVYDSKRHKTVLFGGTGANPHAFSDTWEYDGKKWVKASDSGPGPRLATGYAYDSKRGMFLIFGGMSGGEVKGDTWGWNGHDWKKLAENGPSPRLMGNLAYDKDRDRTVMFGGRPGWPNDTNDTWEWDGLKWTEVK